MVWYYSKLLHQTSFGLAMGGAVPWLWPLFKVLHFAGMALFVGGCVAFNLRLLGVARDLPVEPLRKLARWGRSGSRSRRSPASVSMPASPTST